MNYKIENNEYNNQWSEPQPSWQPTFQSSIKKSHWFTRIFPPRPRTHIILFILTFISTSYVGHILIDGNWWAYSLPIMAILLAHEMGHYLMCRKYNISATLPYFIPFPLNPFGTMGAVIRMKGIIPNRKALFDLGVAGPLAGLVITIPAIIYGIHLSEPVDSSLAGPGTFALGNSILFSQLVALLKGAVPEYQDILLHPIAYAGWAGLFVTALNLMPIGQLDGGHIIYAIFGRNSRNIFYASLAGFSICTVFYWAWALLLILLIFFGFRHPAPLDDFTPLDKKRVALGLLMMVIFLISFTPKPFILS